ncbi:uncharacterized protein BN452_00214 [Clostridium sp. CAG:1013]|nr:uncharacterized protein BN452_00214 [Clostridium sp. CAG:1013]
MNQNQKANKSTIIIAILAVITVAALCVTMWALFLREPSAGDDDKVILNPDYAPQKQEQNAETIPDDTGEKMENPEGGGAVSLTYSNEVTIDISDKAAALYFANPGKSNQDMVIQIAIQDTIILQSGTLSPGNQVKLLNLLEGAEDMLQPGGYEGKFVVLYYDPISGEKSMVNTEIPITINVVG